MIRIICLNPVVDRVYNIDCFKSGTLHKAVPVSVYAGGKGVNIARVVSQLGGKCELYTFLAGNNGKLISFDMEKHGVIVHDFPYEGETRTTINIIDRANHQETEITEAGARIPHLNVSSLLVKLDEDVEEGDIVICSGSIPPGVDPGIYKVIARMVQKKGGECMLDTGDLKNALPCPYSFIKPNKREILSFFKGVDEPLSKLARRMISMGASSVMVSLGSEGALFFKGNQVWKVSVPEVQSLDTIGSGDAAVAGFAKARADGCDEFAAIRLSMAAAVSNAMHQEIGFVEIGQVEDLIDRITIEEVPNET